MRLPIALRDSPTTGVSAESTKKGQLIAYGLTDVERGRAACGSGSLDVEDRREGDDDGGDGEQRW